MIKCIILDDESHCIESLSNMIDLFPEKLQLVQTFREPVKALIYLANNQVDLIFSDIQMNGISGMEFAKKVMGKQKIIFTTAYTEYGANSYEYGVFDYLLKPIEYERFYQAIEKLDQQTIAPPKPFFVKAGNQNILVKPDEIAFISTSAGYLNIYFKHKKEPLLTLCSMSSFEKPLKPYNIHRIHNSHMVNFSHLINFDNNYAEVDLGYGKKTFSISNNYRKKFSMEVEMLGR
jgi:two-component system, LytTR family, response regulator